MTAYAAAFVIGILWGASPAAMFFALLVHHLMNEGA